MSGEEEDNKYSVTELLEAMTSEEYEEPDLSVALEISDRMNKNKSECREAIDTMIRLFKSSKSRVIYNTILVLDCFVKNCQMRFHYEVTSKRFQEALLRLLKRKRGKAGLFDSMFKDKKLWEKIETKVLYLIQLWADTFMMHQDDFKPLFDTYKQLRQEGIPFPERDKNQKFMIQFKGKPSPMFEYLENMDHLKKGGKSPVPSSGSNSTAAQGGTLGFSKNANAIVQASKGKKKENYDEQIDDDKDDVAENDNDFEDLSGKENFAISKEELEIVSTSIQLLEEIIDNSLTIEDLKCEIATEIIENFKEIYKRISTVLRHKTVYSPSERETALEVKQNIQFAIGQYKSKLEYLKDPKNRQSLQEEREKLEKAIEEAQTADGPTPGGGNLNNLKSPSNKFSGVKLRKLPPPGQKIMQMRQQDDDDLLSKGADLLEESKTNPNAPKKPATVTPGAPNEVTPAPPKKKDIDLLDLDFFELPVEKTPPVKKTTAPPAPAPSSLLNYDLPPQPQIQVAPYGLAHGIAPYHTAVYTPGYMPAQYVHTAPMPGAMQGMMPGTMQPMIINPYANALHQPLAGQVPIQVAQPVNLFDTTQRIAAPAPVPAPAPASKANGAEAKPANNAVGLADLDDLFPTNSTSSVNAKNANGTTAVSAVVEPQKTAPTKKEEADDDFFDDIANRHVKH
eukprot:TRINITY_DN4500_c0_g1_i3.p1 TRINITY_DN4500_c0_g1~~TRINITY_DN4500_c0_g1_i3.p1  ORF type:complete len:679 (+),score=146.98 TRINITY_DN4500_c0_g1_i3:146-2182(+)